MTQISYEVIDDVACLSNKTHRGCGTKQTNTNYNTATIKQFPGNIK